MDNSKILFQTNYFSSKVKVYYDRIEHEYPGNVKIILISQIDSIEVGMSGLMQITIRTTGGAKYPIPTSKKSELRDIILKLKNFDGNEDALNEKIAEMNKLSSIKDNDSKKKKDKAVSVGLIIFIAVFILGIIGMIVSPTPPAPTKQEEKKAEKMDLIYPEAIADMTIESILKSPASAKFGRNDATAWTTDPNTFDVIGSVDSQNSFGAMLRSQYYVTVRYNGGDKNSPNSWEILYIKFDGEILVDKLGRSKN